MKAILEFSLPEEQYDYAVHVNAPKLASFVWEFEQWMRNKIKHEDVREISLDSLSDEWYRLKSECAIPEEVSNG